MDDTKGIVVAKRRHAGSAPTTSAPLAWNGEAPENSRIVPQETHRPTSGELLLEGFPLTMRAPETRSAPPSHAGAQGSGHAPIRHSTSG